VKPQERDVQVEIRTADEPAGTAAQYGWAARLRRYAWPLLAAVIALPLAGYAIVCSQDWLGQPFPGFLLMENGVVPTVSAADWPADKGVLFHSQVLAVDGQPVRSSAEVYARVGDAPVGTLFTYQFRGAAGRFTRTLPSRNFTMADYLEIYGVLLFFGAIALISGIVVAFLQPARRAARVYLAQSVITGLYACSAVFLHRPGFPLLARLCLVLECLFAASWVHISLVFPVERRLAGWRRAGVALPYAISAVLALWVLFVFFADPPDATPLHFAYAYNALALAGFIATLALGYRESRDPLPRLRVKAILVGALVCLPWPLLVFVENALAGRSIPVQFALVFTPFGYASLGYAIVQHDLLDIDRIVRRSFAYVLLSIIVLGVYAIVLELSVRMMPTLSSSGQTLISMGFVLVLAFVLDPLRRFLQEVVDQAFGRGRLDYRGTIRELSAVLATLLDLQEIITQVTRVVTESMQLESTAVCLANEAGTDTVYCRRRETGVVRWDEPDAVSCVTRAAHAHLDCIDPDRLVAFIENPAERRHSWALIDQLKPKLLVPLVIQGRAIGLLMFGPKRSGHPFDSEAIDLLRTLADQTAIAVQNARSHEALEVLNRDLDAQVRRRTAELRQAYDDLKSAQAQLVQSEKMASLGQLVAGVAHELNNPASFAYAGLENIEESLRHLIAVLQAYERVPITDPSVRAEIERIREDEQLPHVLQETPQLLRISAEGLERIRRIIDDLRSFARADSGERMLTNVAEGVERSVQLLGPRLSRHNIHLIRSYGDVPLIGADASQLNQVWMNLIANAIEAVEEQDAPEIAIQIRASPTADFLEVVVTDNGRGIAPEHLQRLFEPFFTTKPIGKGTGLGLSIAYGAIKAHGGTIDISSEDGRGTKVIVRLPMHDGSARSAEAP
jgi:signal transduction histidine kinase